MSSASRGSATRRRMNAAAVLVDDVGQPVRRIGGLRLQWRRASFSPVTCRARILWVNVSGQARRARADAPGRFDRGSRRGARMLAVSASATSPRRRRQHPPPADRSVVASCRSVALARIRTGVQLAPPGTIPPHRRRHADDEMPGVFNPRRGQHRGVRRVASGASSPRRAASAPCPRSFRSPSGRSFRATGATVRPTGP